MSDQPRMTPERLAEIRALQPSEHCDHGNSRCPICAINELLAELDAVTQERDTSARRAIGRFAILYNRMWECQKLHPGTHTASIIEIPEWINDQKPPNPPTSPPQATNNPELGRGAK